MNVDDLTHQSKEEVSSYEGEDSTEEEYYSTEDEELSEGYGSLEKADGNYSMNSQANDNPKEEKEDTEDNTLPNIVEYDNELKMRNQLKTNIMNEKHEKMDVEDVYSGEYSEEFDTTEENPKWTME